MKCDVCGKPATRFVVSRWDSTWDWPLESIVTKSISKSNKIGKRLFEESRKLGFKSPNVGLEVLCYKDLYQA